MADMGGGGRALPKFGEWDVNDPASAEGFTFIFNKARNEKKIGATAGPTKLHNNTPPIDNNHKTKYKMKKIKKKQVFLGKPQSKKWLWCIKPNTFAES